MSTIKTSSIDSQTAIDPLRTEIIERLSSRITETGIFDCEIPDLLLIRSNQVGEPVYSVQKPMLCVIVQGQKQVILADQIFTYDAARYLVVSVDLPISGQITQASPDKPYLCLGITIEPKEIYELLRDDHNLSGPASPGLFVSPTNVGLMDAVLRLTRLLSSPQDVRVLAPMLRREILFRLLQDEQSGAVRQLGIADSQTQRISRAIDLIRREYSRALSIDQLAHEAGMSASSLHQHFKTLTAMSPLQYQKQLRLQEARRLLMTGDCDAASAAFSVGYESPSHFNREYARLFGLPPIKDLQRLREQGYSLVG